MDAFEHDGVWWDPANPHEQWVGTLQFDPSVGATLVVTLPPERPNPFPPLESYDLLVGVTTAGKRITLIDCLERLSTAWFGAAPRRIEIFAHTVVVGLHCESADPLMASASVTFQHLSEWWRRAGIEFDLTERLTDVGVRYVKPEPLVVQDDDTWRVSVGPAIAGTFRTDRVALWEIVRLVIEAKTPRPFSEFRPRISAFGDFLSIACLTLCSVDELVIVDRAEPGECAAEGTVHDVPIYKRRERRASLFVRSLLHFADIDGRAREILRAWFAESDRLLEIRALYLLGVYGEGFVTGKLLALTQGAEAFHRRFCPGDYMEPEAFEEQVRGPMTAAIPKGLDDPHKDAIRSRIKFANEYSQSRRFAELVDEHADALQVLVENPGGFVRPIIDVRNAFTHFPYPSPEHGRDPEEVLRFNWFLQLLLECCFLKTMGFSPAEITTVAHRSQTYQQLAALYFKRNPRTPGEA
jgi:hypothetical protein